MRNSLQLRAALAVAPDGDACLAELQGIACLYDEPADRGDYFVQFAKGCFDISAPVRFRLDHEAALDVGGTDTGELKLFDNFDGLRFVLRLPDTKMGRRAWREFQAGVRGMSVGAKIEDEEIRETRAGEQISTVYHAVVREISLVEYPGIAGCRAELIEPGVKREDEITPVERLLRACTCEAERRFWTERALEFGYALP